jgi:hypothetical protein
MIYRVVEMTVGVICSCLPSFAGFFRYHLPLLRSILSLFSSNFSRLLSPRQSSQPTNSGSSKRLATKDIKITLGSRINGRGHFLTSTGVFTKSDDWPPISEAVRNSLVCVNESDATRREYYETTENQDSSIQHPASVHSDPARANIECSLSPDVESGIALQRTSPDDHPQSLSTKPRRFRGIGTWKLPWQSETHTGYWDIMSLFRTGNIASTSHQKSHSESPSSSTEI